MTFETQSPDSCQLHDFIVRVMMFIVVLKTPAPGAEYLGFHFSLPCGGGGGREKRKELILALMNVEKARIYVLSVPKCAKTKDSMEKNPEYINSHDF